MVRKLALAAGIVALSTAPLAASQARAQLSRDAAPVGDASDLGDSNTIYFIAGIAAVAAAIVLLSEDGDDAPVSV